MDKKRVIRLIQHIDFWGIREWAKENDLDWIVVYGSQVYGDPKDDSDLDIGFAGPIKGITVPGHLISEMEADEHHMDEVNAGVRYGMSKGLLIYQRQEGLFKEFIEMAKKEFSVYKKKIKQELEEDLEEGYIIIQDV
ncbi:hypothetical protein Desaci_4108 [Desulfosporosinus acidiphilus SJ4]|uniref:Polymerase beta nucleotidyltransferase domain-containing protein n=1 Tax=Desulfosporosinus acidiphilus (strain DSM 22704 / JCM 16185 / SJ4) TaxID=646529 RepID=I4DAZ7_DESAJ|nr:hypothetical protein [Desulfosporosinus acidiphilus]AFM42971.1 hypothetical protein Desaci_4108 [Desulfosporosinus acidiphilus SJ4]